MAPGFPGLARRSRKIHPEDNQDEFAGQSSVLKQLNMLADIIDYLHQQQRLYKEMLVMTDREGQDLQKFENSNAFENFQAKKSLLPQLNQSLERLREQRIGWQKLTPDQRAKHPEVASLIRQNQDLIMKIIVLDRENEQTLLRRGLMPPQRIPSLHRPHPHFLADLYRRRSAS